MTVQAWITLIVGIVGFGGVIGTLRQRERSESRAEWWRRMTWSLDHAFRGNEGAQTLGLEVVGELQKSRLATPAERGLVRIFSEQAADRVASLTFLDLMEKSPGLGVTDIKRMEPENE